MKTKPVILSATHVIVSFIFWVLFMAGTPVVLGQTLELDPNFKPFITRNFSAVYAVAIQSDNKLLIGGDFLQVGGVTASKIARLNSNGSPDPNFQTGTGIQGGSVLKIVVQNDGKILIGGRFTHINGVRRNYIARLNSDGSLDTSFDPGAGPDGVITSLGLQSDGKVIIIGGFLNVNDTVRGRVARLNTDGSLDLSFDPGTGITDPSIFATVSVSELTVQPDDKAIVAGRFTQVNGVTRGSIVRFNTNGAVDPTFAPSSGIQYPGGSTASVSGMALQPDGRIVVVGSFTRVNGTVRTNVARLTATGATDSSFLLSPAPDVQLYCVAVQTNRQILVGGALSTAGGVPRNRIVRLSESGAVDPFFDPGTAARGFVYTILVQPDQRLVLGELANGSGRPLFERLDTNGSPDPSFATDLGLNVGIVNAAIFQPDGKIIVGGDFNAIDGVSRNRIARLNQDGTLDQSFDPGIGASGSLQQVHSLALQPDGKVLLGGGFTSVNGTARNRIARLNSDGSLDSDFTPGTGANSRVWTIQPQSDGKILIGGDFTSYNSTSKPYLARLNTNGTLDTSFPVGSGPNGSVLTSALQPDGKIIVGGRFSSVSGTSRNARARLLSTGAVDTNFVPVSVSVTEILATVVQPDGKIVFGGYFFYTGGISNWTSIQRLWPDGSLDTNNVSAPYGETANAVVLDTDDSVLFGTGNLLSKSQPATPIGRMKNAGTFATNEMTLDSIVDAVLALATFTNSTVICGGNFSTVYNEPRYGLARLVNNLPAPPRIRIEPSDLPGMLQLNVSGQIGRNYAVETSTNFISWIEYTNLFITSEDMVLQIPMNQISLFMRAASR